MKTLKLFLFSLLIIGFESYGHVELKESSPGNNDMLMSSPDNLTLMFDAPVMVVKVSLSSAQGEAVDFNFNPSTESSEHHSWTLPTLTPNTYKISVVYLGKDGHKMTKDLSFMVH